MQPMQPDPTASAFAVRGLTKVYGDKAVVDHLNLDVPRGEYLRHCRTQRCR